MRYKIKKRYIIIAAVNAAALLSAGGLTMRGNALAKSQYYNYAAERWKGDSDESFSQISCFISNDADFNINNAKTTFYQIQNKLVDASYDFSGEHRWITQAYSAPLGVERVGCDMERKAEADITAVGGDFFLFHEFRLLDGCFFDDDDIMKDGAVIDRELAWQLYGSDNVVGMNIYINDVKMYISGVIETPSTEPEKKCIGSKPMAYVSYESAGLIKGSDASADFTMSDSMYEDNELPKTNNQDNFSKVTCYELIIPDPVENFAINYVEELFKETYVKDRTMKIVRNTGRFEPKKMAKNFSKLYKSTIIDDSVAYPFWENASRVAEFRLSYIFFARRIIMMIPLLTAAWFIFLLARNYRRKKLYIKRTIAKKADRLWQRLKNIRKTPDRGRNK
ncbi:MAG: ABC transporter permease [Ruminococcus sp.]|nr:ABC transporter permease [Ruminococcus sp.]